MIFDKEQSLQSVELRHQICMVPFSKVIVCDGMVNVRLFLIWRGALTRLSWASANLNGNEKIL